MSTTAGVVINKVRDLIPDPVRDGSGNPLPDSNGGLFYADTLYRWLSDGVKACAQGMGWVIHDWYALPSVNGQPNYALDPKWIAIENCLVNKWVLSPMDESLSIFPTAELVTKQPVRYGVHKNIDQQSLFLFPAPNTTDPTTTVTNVGGISASATSCTVASTAGFLPDGYVQIDNEILKYETLTGGLGTLTRGQCGTTAATHAQNATVTHLSIWVKGPRMTADISASTSVIELPTAFIFMLELYVLSKCRESEQEFQRADQLMARFDKELMGKKTDPYWQSLDTVSVASSGSMNLAWGRVVLP